MSNPHLDATKEWLEYSAADNPDNGGGAMHAAALAQAEATLALAYEQRTANLIALGAMGVTNISDWSDFQREEWLSIMAQAYERLGLEDTK